MVGADIGDLVMNDQSGDRKFAWPEYIFLGLGLALCGGTYALDNWPPAQLPKNEGLKLLLGTLGAIMLLLAGRKFMEANGCQATRAAKILSYIAVVFAALEVIPKDWIASLPWSLRAALGLALFAFIIGAGFRAFWVLLLSDAANRNKAVSVETHGVPDPKKWTHDPETGEYHRITFTNKEGIIYDSRTYDDRRLIYLRELEKLRETGRMFLIGLIGTPIFGYMTYYIWDGRCRLCEEHWFLDIFGKPGTAMVTLWCALMLVFGSILLIIQWLTLPFKKAKVGPPPIPPRGREDVETQKVHGEGRFATPEEIDRAARGYGTAGGGFDDRTFHD